MIECVVTRERERAHLSERVKFCDLFFELVVDCSDPDHEKESELDSVASEKQESSFTFSMPLEGGFAGKRGSHDDDFV